MEAFRHVALAQSYGSIVTALQRMLPEETAPVPVTALHQVVAHAYHQAQPLGLEQEATLTVFAAFCFLGGDVARLPEVVGAPGLDETIKAKLLTLLVLAQTGKDVQSNE